MKCLAKMRPLFCGLACPEFNFHPIAGYSTGGKKPEDIRVQRQSKHSAVAWLGATRTTSDIAKAESAWRDTKGHWKIHPSPLCPCQRPQCNSELSALRPQNYFFFFYFLHCRETLSWLWWQLLAEARIIDLDMQERLKLLHSQPSGQTKGWKLTCPRVLQSP